MTSSESAIRPIDHLPQMGQPGAQALVLKSSTLTYAELEEQVGRLAAWLAGFGFEPGARVASWSAKGALTCLLPLACARVGLVHVPVNPLLKHGQAAYILQDCGAALLVASAGRIASLATEPSGNGCALIEENEALAASEAMAPLPPSDADPDNLAAILYTSGSTGKPKGVMLSQANLWLGAVSVADYLGIDPHDRVLAVLPLSFDYGQNQLYSTWAGGGAVVPLDYLTARDVVKAVGRNEITTLAGVPPLWVQLVEAEWPRETATRLRRLTNSGGALSRKLIAAMRAQFTQADIYPMYGLTEAFRSTYLPPDLVDDHPESMGRAIPNAEILVCRKDGSITRDGEHGELVHCGPLVAKGYWNDPMRTTLRFRPAPPSSSYGGIAVWSGDTVLRDAEGLLYFVGRDDAMIKSAGNRISPSEIEDAAAQVSGVAESVAFGVPDDRLGQAVLLLVRAAGGIHPEAVESAIRDHFRHELPNFMMPREIRFVSAFPRNANGKIDRSGLTNEHSEIMTESAG